MIKVLLICLLLFTSKLGHSQNKNDDDDFKISTATVDSEWDKEKKAKSDAFWATMKILDTWEHVVTSKNGEEWYIFKKPESVSDDYTKTYIRVYYPKYTNHSDTFTDVIIDEKILFDCKNNQYKILEAKYYYDYIELFDIVDNPKGKFRKITPKSISDALLRRACK